MADLFQRIDDRRDDWNVEVMVTFLEIYNEEIRDLLSDPDSSAPRGGLSIREDKAVKVVGLVELKPKSAEEVKEIVLQGNLRRTQSPTLANATSSRSHAVLQVHVTQTPRTAALSEQRTMATLSIIDLAGSERAAATTNMGQRMVEGANINKSLLALGNCINSLCESGGAVRHVPYRNSKLTRLLKFSLGGNCKTVMIVCVAPTSNHFDDTHNTLIYAERATKIKTKVVTRNVVNVDRHVGRYVEAINRLNLEVAELKAKLAGQNNSDNEVQRRKKSEAKAEVERAKNDLKAKSDQTRVSIIDGALCTGKLGVAKTKLAAINARLAVLDTEFPDHSFPVDIQAERTLLLALSEPEEQAMKSDSPLSLRLQRSLNSRSMFDATMRAVVERKMERLDEVSVDNVKLDARCRTAEIETLKLEEERNVLKEAVQDLSRDIVGLLGLLGRCTVMISEASKTLEDRPNDNFEANASRVALALQVVKVSNDQTFTELVGKSVGDYASQSRSDVLDSFKGYNSSFTRRVTSDPPVRPKAASKRASAYGALAPVSPPRRTFRSPRKSLRSSLASQPYRKVSDKEKKAAKSGKNVQWRDEVGAGNLEEGLSAVIPKIVLPPSPTANVVSSSSSSATTASTVRSAPVRNMSIGSESEWEDENDKTDDSVGFLSRSLPASSSARSYGPLTGTRPRPSRLDPSFLKSKKASTLGSLAEDDESSIGSPQRHVSQPLGDRLNQLPEADAFNDSRKISTGKGPQRIPSTPKIPGARSRRRSGIGALRLEKSRRRSSMIPQLSPADDSKPRRVPTSPVKKPRRVSSSRPGRTTGGLSIADASADVSFNRSTKPTWR